MRAHAVSARSSGRGHHARERSRRPCSTHRAALGCTQCRRGAGMPEKSNNRARQTLRVRARLPRVGSKPNASERPRRASATGATCAGVVQGGGRTASGGTPPCRALSPHRGPAGNCMLVSMSSPLSRQICAHCERTFGPRFFIRHLRVRHANCQDCTQLAALAEQLLILSHTAEGGAPLPETSARHRAASVPAAEVDDRGAPTSAVPRRTRQPEPACDCDCTPGMHWCILCERHGVLARQLGLPFPLE
jgi:hypothetical protein